MTREEKIELLDKYCREAPLNLCNSRKCPAYAPDTIEDYCNNTFEERTDEELDAALHAIGAPHPEALDHPGHYNREGAMECIEEMLLLFGREETMSFCKLNAWKYRYRAADKGGMDDLKKSDRYLAKYKELKERTE